MSGIEPGKNFFLNDSELDELDDFSVGLNHAAAELLATRSDFTIAELLNFAFRKEWERQKANGQSVRSES